MTQKQDIFGMMGGAAQFRRGIYNPTSDAVWLAAAAPTGAKTVLDVGIGTGGVTLCYLVNHPTAHVTGIDISDEMLAAAADNATLNARTITLYHADITTWRTGETFDLVMTNPPYFYGTPARHNAHHNADLITWIQRCIARVRPRGYFCTIIDAAVLGNVMATIAPRCGDITLYPLFGSNQWAERVIIRARAGTHGPTIVYPGIHMNDERILRDGLTLDDFFTKLGPKC